jgi:lipopolysaccharide transport system ATP-binding protein
VLAVGDTVFQNKCLGKMGDISRSGRTVLFVSHNLGIVSQLCREAIWLNEGQMVRMGPTDEIIHNYLAAISANTTGSWNNDKAYEIQQHIRLLSASMRTRAEAQATAVIRFDEAFFLQLDYEILTPVESWSLVFRVTDASGTMVFTSWDTDFIESHKPTRVGSYQASCRVPAKLLRPGIYSVSLGIYIPRDRNFDIQEHMFQFEISSVGYTMNANRRGVITPLLEWSIIQA